MSNQPVLNEPSDDAKERIEGFMKEYQELTQKWKVDTATYPMFIPDGQGGFRVVLQSSPVDISKAPVKSPFVV